MYIEYRLNDDRPHLVTEKTNENVYLTINCSQEGFLEYGIGNELFFFQGIGRACQPFALDLIHADGIEEAEEMIQERYADRLKRGTLIRKRRKAG